MVQEVSSEWLASKIKDNDTIFTVGMTLSGSAEEILKAIETRFQKERHPQNLTLVHASGQSDRRDGIQHLAHEGLVTRIIGSHWGLAPKWMELISNNVVQAYCLPQGQVIHWLRSMAAGLPGHLTQIGLGTFVDPRQDGGKMNARTVTAPDLIHLVEVRGQQYLWIDAVPLDWVIVRGTTADDKGNVSAEDEAMKLEILPAVFATRRFEGRVAVQVKTVVPRGTLNPRQVEIPGVHVDYVIRVEHPELDHRQTSGWFFDSAFSSEGWRPALQTIELQPLDVRRIIGRRAILELTPGAIVNMGTGIPNDVIGPEVLHEKAADCVALTVESGVYGGRPVGGVDFGIAEHPDALIEHPYQFDFYNGRGVDITFMGFGEVDAQGHVNATKLRDRATGAGGFIDITQSAKKVVFCGTFTTRGLSVSVDHHRLTIVKEGQISKWVATVQQISFNGMQGVARGQQILVVTERAVFRLTPSGWELTEVASGIDLERDVLGQMSFQPQIAPEIRIMEPRIFSDDTLNLLGLLRQGSQNP